MEDVAAPAEAFKSFIPEVVKLTLDELFDFFAGGFIASAA